MDEDSNDPLEPEMFNLESEESAYEESASRGLGSQHYVQIEEEPFQPNMYHREERMKQEILQNDEDEDRQFALSIVPALRKLDDKQKFEAKIEILKVLKKISTGDDFWLWSDINKTVPHCGIMPFRTLKNTVGSVKSDIEILRGKIVQGIKTYLSH